jgi:hypothetical protein
MDAADPSALARFWCGMLAVTVDAQVGDGEFLILSPTQDGLTVGFQRVARGTPTNNNRLAREEGAVTQRC